MVETEKPEFGRAVTQLFAIYDMEVTSKVLTAWWGVLAPYHLSAVLAAMNLHASDPEAGMYRPTPAHVRRHLERTIPALMKERREAIIREARMRIAPHVEAIERARADYRLGLIDEKDLTMIVSQQERQRALILSDPDVMQAMAPQARLRDEAAAVAPVDRMPDVVRQALGWLGKLNRRLH